MGKTSAEQTGNKYIVTNRLSHPEAINEREMNAIAGGMLDGLIPVVAERKKKDVIVKCSVVGMITLRSYFRGIVTKKMFLDSVSQIIRLVKECEKNLMNSNNLLLDMDYIFLDPRTKSIKCILWPIVNNQNAKTPSLFFNELPFNLVFNKHEDNNYVSEYLKFFRSASLFLVSSFERLIWELAGKSISNNRVPSGSTAFNSEQLKTPASEELKGDTGNIAYDPLANMKRHNTTEVKNNLCQNCGKTSSDNAKFCSVCGNPLIEMKDETSRKKDENNGTTVLGANSDSGGTTVLGAYEGNEPSFPSLIREKTQENICVNKPVFRIGKERQYTDLFISDNSAVSRSHADIITRDGRYYIIDRNSTNKTYIDERVIPAEKEIEIFSGTKVKLANEEFIFYI